MDGEWCWDGWMDNGWGGFWIDGWVFGWVVGGG